MLSVLTYQEAIKIHAANHRASKNRKLSSMWPFIILHRREGDRKWGGGGVDRGTCQDIYGALTFPHKGKPSLFLIRFMMKVVLELWTLLDGISTTVWPHEAGV